MWFINNVLLNASFVLGQRITVARKDEPSHWNSPALRLSLFLFSFFSPPFFLLSPPAGGGVWVSLISSTTTGSTQRLASVRPVSVCSPPGSCLIPPAGICFPLGVQKRGLLLTGNHEELWILLGRPALVHQGFPSPPPLFVRCFWVHFQGLHPTVTATSRRLFFPL